MMYVPSRSRYRINAFAKLYSFYTSVRLIWLKLNDKIKCHILNFSKIESFLTSQEDRQRYISFWESHLPFEWKSIGLGLNFRSPDLHVPWPLIVYRFVLVEKRKMYIFALTNWIYISIKLRRNKPFLIYETNIYVCLEALHYGRFIYRQ